MACCGSGPYRGVFSCGGKEGVKDYELCKNPNEYVFFDSDHFTESQSISCSAQMEWKWAKWQSKNFV